MGLEATPCWMRLSRAKQESSRVEPDGAPVAGAQGLLAVLHMLKTRARGAPEAQLLDVSPR